MYKNSCHPYFTPKEVIKKKRNAFFREQNFENFLIEKYHVLSKTKSLLEHLFILVGKIEYSPLCVKFMNVHA